MRLIKRDGSDRTGFAVIDVETTGKHRWKDRVVEVAVVHLDSDGAVTGEFCTLIDPGRDVGPTQLHGITAADVAGAPTFVTAAATVWEWLTGRVLVAHNAAFDVGILDAEFGRCGVHLPQPQVMCTMDLAHSYLPAAARSLAACCEAAGVVLTDHHSALADARAAAQLLASYRAAHRLLPDSWKQALTEAAGEAWFPGPPVAQFEPVTRAEQRLRRANQPPPLAGLVNRLPRGSTGGLDAYLAVLDEVLEDRLITQEETTRLLEVAAGLGLAREGALRAHHGYLEQVAAAAWRDGRVTGTERADFLDVARLLGVPDSEALAVLEAGRQASHGFPGLAGTALRPGDRVVFTGDMAMSRTEIQEVATAAGLRVTGAVSGKTALLVTADPYSQSGKAKQARGLGVRIVTEQVFLYLLDAMQAGGDTAAAAGR